MTHAIEEISASRNLSKARVTVVLCCYNHESYFLPAIDSIRAQTIAVDCIILNNGANDSYSNLIQRVAGKRGLKVVEVQPNTYGLAIREKILPFVETEFVAILHDDDLYLPEKIATSVKVLDETESDFIVTNADYIDARGNTWRGSNEAVNDYTFTGAETRGWLLAAMVIPPGATLHYSTLVMRTALAKKTMLGDPFWPRIADALFWTELLLDEELRFVILDKPLSRIRIHDANDRLYEKFDEQERQIQYLLLVTSEIEFFQRMLHRTSPALLMEFLNAFTGTVKSPSLTEALIVSAVLMDRNSNKYWLPKLYLIPLLVHKAFSTDPLLTCDMIETLSGQNANKFMTNAYRRFAQVAFSIDGNSNDVRIHGEEPSHYKNADVNLKWIARHPIKAVARGFYSLAELLGGRS